MKKAAAILLLAAFGLCAQAQEAPAPFVSRLKAQAGPTSIVLTWREAPGVPGLRRVYRHTLEIDDAGFPAAVQIASVAAGVLRYEDFPPDGRPYYYAVLLTGVDGSPYRLFIPFRNKTSAPAQITGATPEENRGTEAEAAAASADGAPPAPGPQGSPPAIAESPAPSQPPPAAGPEPAAAAQEGRAAAASSGPEAAATDQGGVAAPGAAHEPAATDRGSAAAPAPGAREPAGQARSAPLPYLAPDSGLVSAGPPLPALRPLAPETQRAVEALLANAPPLKAAGLSAQALPEDLNAPAGSESYELGVILEKHLLKGDFEGAKGLLLAFLAVPHAEAAAARAHFYLGQACFLQGSYRESVEELLPARDRYYAAVEPWLDAGLLRLRDR